jgi:acetyl esterase/lipase
MGLPVLELPGWEADDLQGTVAAMAGGDVHAYILTGDRDLLQLISPSVTVLLATNGDTLTMDRDAFFEKYGVEPSQFVDVKAIMGDSSGGHTATYAGILKDDDSPYNLFPGVSSKVSCIVNYYGSTDLTFDDSNPQTTNHNLPDSPEGMAMGGINLREDAVARNLLTCRANIDEDTDFPPIIHFHGTKDRTVNTRCTTLLHEHLVACGHESTLYLIKGADHGGPEFWTDEVLDIVDGFVRAHL